MDRRAHWYCLGQAGGVLARPARARNTPPRPRPAYPALKERCVKRPEGFIDPFTHSQIGGASMEREANETERPGNRPKTAFTWLSIALATVALVWPAITFAAPVVFEASGSSPEDIRAAFKDFGDYFGGKNNGVNGGSFQDGHREINWDGVPDAFAAPNILPANFFNKNSARGVVFFTPGSGFQVSANQGVAPIEFDNLRPDASGKFAHFRRQRLFTALASPITEVLFFVPGTAQAATTKGFGAVFTHVEHDDSAKIEYFDVNGHLLYSGFAPPAEGSETLSFLAVAFDEGEQVFLVRITSGDVELAGNNRGGRDLVVMDDFIYGEPQPLP